MRDTGLRVLIACEFSGTVRNAFNELGHDAWSCDILPDVHGSNRHIRGDVRDHLGDGWDLMMVAHPPCTRLCNSGVRWLTGEKLPKSVPSHSEAEQAEYLSLTSDDDRRAWLWRKMGEGADLFSDLWNAPIPCIAAENPQMHKYAKQSIRNFIEPAQTVQPWWFGDPAFKGTSLWLRNLPPLVDTNRLTPPKKGDPEYKAWSAIHYASPGKDRGKLRSIFFPGIAAAMAEQWGEHALEQAAQRELQAA